MANKKLKKQQLTIYLAKDNQIADKDLIDISRTSGAHKVDVEGCSATIYGKKFIPDSLPVWASFFTSTNLSSLDGIVDKTTSTGAILIVSRYQKKFIITFGKVAHILKPGVIERDFGLKVTLNSVNPSKLRSLDKTSYNAKPLNSRNQSVKEVDIFDLSVDSETDVVYALTGASKVDKL